jgi:hypothetical protein
MNIITSKFVKRDNLMIKIPCGFLICDNCTYADIINENHTCFILCKKFVCYYCKSHVDICENAIPFIIDSYSINEIYKIRRELYTYNVIKQWKNYHEKFKLLKKIIRNWVFMKREYLNPYSEIGKLRIRLVQIKWNRGLEKFDK